MFWCSVRRNSRVRARRRDPLAVPRALAWAAGTLILASAPLDAQQPAAPSLTVEQAIERAVAANQSLAAARLQRSVAAADVAIAAERPNPDLSFEAERETPKQAVGLSLPIELGGKRQSRIALANASVGVAEADIATAATQVENDVRRAYYAAVAADRRVVLATETRALAQRVRDTAATRAQAGDVAQLEVVQTDIGVFEADQDVSAARGDAAAARTDLNVLIGQPADAAFTLTSDLSLPPLPPLADLLSRIDTTNTTLLTFERRIAEQTARRTLAASLRVPDVSIGGAVTYLAEPEFRAGWRASAGVTLPLFTSHTAAVTREDAELARLRAERDAARATIAGSVAAALARAAASREQVTRFENDILPALARAEQMVQEGYSAGHTPLVSVLAALQQARESRTKGLQAALDYQMALVELERAMGTKLR